MREKQQRKMHEEGNSMKRIRTFLAGILTGALLFTGTVAYASGIMAERSTHRIFVDGQEVQMEAYSINWNNYTKLRDIGKAVGFNVYWDSVNNCVQIESNTPYTGEPPAEENTEKSVGNAEQEEEPCNPSKDVSNQANPAIFTGGYTREAYNALRQTMGSGGKSELFPISNDSFVSMQSVSAAFGQWPFYDIKRSADGKAYFTATYSKNNQIAATACESFINSLSGMSEREKVKEIAFFVCDHLTYDASSTALPYQALTSNSVSKGNCMSYAHNFLFLCDMAGIPCVFVHSSTHQWNEVYVDGTWWDVDVSSTDSGDDYDRRYSQVLHSSGELGGSVFTQTEPELTAFVKELLVPGSSK